MSTAPTVSFRDFAAAVMSGRRDDAAGALAQLLGLDAAAAAAATDHFATGMQTGGQDFMMKAMGLRYAVTSGDDAAVRDVLQGCFGLSGAALEGAAGALGPRT
jgi:hypothetical protein